MLTILQNSENLLHDVRCGKRKVVGWGTGSIFHSLANRSSLPLQYLIDSDPSKWGKVLDGLQIRPPSDLERENPAQIYIVIFSSFTREIEQQISAYGPFVAISSGHLFYDEKAASRIRTVCKIADSTASFSRTNRKPQSAILIQGPITTNTTLTALRYYRATQPDACLILSTWKGQPPETLEAVAPWCDRLLLLDPPKIPGRQNRNLQARSTIAGLREANSLGIETIVKTRTDCILARPQLSYLLSQTCNLYSKKRPQSFGLRGRIAVASSYTRKWIPYHPSDLVMFGAVDDLIRYWDLSPDLEEPAADWSGLSLADLSRYRFQSETYAGRAFAQSIGWSLRNTITDSWSFYRDCFVILDDPWLGLIWSKNLGGAPGTSEDIPSSACIDHAFWQYLYFELPLPSGIDAIAERNSWLSQDTPPS